MRKTKIVCTIGPACNNEKTLTEMCLAGMNVARLNFSHGTHEDHLKNIELIKTVREKLNMPIAILLDTKGPEYRIKTFKNGKIFLNEGDLVSVDLVVLKNGFHGDCARTYIVGETSKEAKKLVEATKQAFFEGIKYAKVGNRIGDISHAIGEYVSKHGYSVVKEFQGHGIGRQMHEEPGIPNYGKEGRGIRLEKGMTLAIEPMVIQGKSEILELEDGWTIITEDGSLSAHYENTILITEKEPQVLTLL